MDTKSKQRVPNQDKSEMKVLIVVDVQNCFIQGGSLNETKDIEPYINQATIIANLVDSGNYDLVVFTRDYHPKNHASLYNEQNPVYGTYLPHCRNENLKCNQRYTEYNDTDEKIKKNNILTPLIRPLTRPFTNTNKLTQFGNEIDSSKYKQIIQIINENSLVKSHFKSIAYEKYKNNYVIGTNLSYLFYGTTLAEKILTLNNDDTNKYTIGLNHLDKDSILHKNDPKIKNIKWEAVKSLLYTNKNNKKTKIIALTKGEYCNYESYSAFNYHFSYAPIKDNVLFKDEKQNNLTKLVPTKNHSTGLFEYILKDRPSNKITIDVCGLVTNICVINSVQQGLAMWHILYKRDYNDLKVDFRLLDYASLPLKLAEASLMPYLDTYYPWETSISANTNEDKEKNQEKQLNNAITLFYNKYINDIQTPITNFNLEQYKLYNYYEENKVNVIYKYFENKYETDKKYIPTKKELISYIFNYKDTNKKDYEKDIEIAVKPIDELYMHNMKILISKGKGKGVNQIEMNFVDNQNKKMGIDLKNIINNNIIDDNNRLFMTSLSDNTIILNITDFNFTLVTKNNDKETSIVINNNNDNVQMQNNKDPVQMKKKYLKYKQKYTLLKKQIANANKQKYCNSCNNWSYGNCNCNN